MPVEQQLINTQKQQIAHLKKQNQRLQEITGNSQEEIGRLLNELAELRRPQHELRSGSESETYSYSYGDGEDDEEEEEEERTRNEPHEIGSARGTREDTGREEEEERGAGDSAGGGAHDAECMSCKTLQEEIKHQCTEIQTLRAQLQTLREGGVQGGENDDAKSKLLKLQKKLEATIQNLTRLVKQSKKKKGEYESNLNSSRILSEDVKQTLQLARNDPDPEVRARMYRKADIQLVELLISQGFTDVLDTQQEQANKLRTLLETLRNKSEPEIDTFMQDDTTYNLLVELVINVNRIKTEDSATKVATEESKKEENVEQHVNVLTTRLKESETNKLWRRWLKFRLVLLKQLVLCLDSKTRSRQAGGIQRLTHYKTRYEMKGGDGTYYVAELKQISDGSSTNLLEQCKMKDGESKEDHLERLDQMLFSKSSKCNVSCSLDCYKAAMTTIGLDLLGSKQSSKWIGIVLAMEGFHPKLMRLSIEFEDYNFLNFTELGMLVENAKKKISLESKIEQSKASIAAHTQQGGMAV